MYIRDCSDKNRTVIEDTSATLICGQYRDQVEWSYLNNLQRSPLGNCDRKGCTLYDRVALPVKLSRFTTSVSWVYESKLEIIVVSRQLAYVYQCLNTYTWETTTCGLRVIGELDSEIKSSGFKCTMSMSFNIRTIIFVFT